MNNQYESLLDALKDLKVRGFDSSFCLTPKGMFSPANQTYYTSDNVNLVEFHRFEGDTDLEDMAIIYVLETTDHQKGVLIDSYGTYANSELGDFLRTVKNQ